MNLSHDPYPRRFPRRDPRGGRIVADSTIEYVHGEKVQVFSYEQRDPQRRTGVGAGSRIPREDQRTAPQACPNCGKFGGSVDMDSCFRKGRPCDWARVPVVTFNTLAATAFVLNIQPINKIWFEPIAASNIVTENGNPNANARVRYTGFQIAGVTQEPFGPVAGAAATAAALWSDHYLPNQNTNNPQPVIWGIFGQTALGKQLVIDGFNPGGVAVDVEFVTYGNATDTPMGKPGVPMVAF